MARAKSERARSKTLAIDDLTQSIEQLQSFIPKLEDLGREGFPYLEGALARTELQLRECLKRGFGEKSPEFQSHRHLKLALSTPAEKKQTLALLRALIVSLEEKKLELQGLKPPAVQASSPAPTPPQLALVPPVVSAAHVSVTSVTSSAHPTGTTLHLVPTVETPAVQAPPTTAPPRPTSPAPAQAAPSIVAAGAAPSIPPRASIEPISSLFRTQETKPVLSTSPPRPQASAAAPPPPPVAATAAPAVPSAAIAPPAVSTPPDAPPVVDTAPVIKAASPPMPTPTSAASGPATHAVPPAAGFSATQEFPVTPAAIVAPSTAPAPAAATGSERDHLAIAKHMCQRFHAVARQLRLRGEYRSTVSVDDEFDVQDLVHALLRHHFDDIGTDEWTPAYSNGTPRTSFLLDHDRLAVVVKKTRPGLSRKDLTDQVRVDADRYRDRGRCTHLLCFIYDPDGRVGNPRGLESELTTLSDHFTVEVMVAPK